MIYESGVCFSPIFLHNVPIRDSRHCGSAHHLVPATSTPGESYGERNTDRTKRQGVKGKKKETECALPSAGLYSGQDQIHLGAKDEMKEHDGKA